MIRSAFWNSVCAFSPFDAEKNASEMGEAQRRRSNVMEWFMFEKFLILKKRQLGENMI